MSKYKPYQTIQSGSKKYLLILIAGFMIIQCSRADESGTARGEIVTKDESENYRVQLEKRSEFSIEPAEGLRLDAVRDLVSFNQADSLMLWVNTLQNQLFVTDTDGNVHSFFGREGAGPHEFRDITATGFNSSDQIVVYDWKLDLVKIFDLQGNLVDEMQGLLDFDLWIRADRIFSSESDLLLGIQEAVGQAEIWETSVIARITPSGELHSLFGGYGPDLEERNLFYNHPDFVYQKQNDRVYITHSSYHVVELASAATGETIQRFGVVPDNFRYAEEQVVKTDSREERDEKNLNQSNVGPPFLSDNYLFFNYNNFTEEFFEKIDRQSRTYNPNLRENYVAIYDHSRPFTYYGEVQLPFTPLGVTRDGDIFLLEDDHPDQFTVGIYRVVIEEQ